MPTFVAGPPISAPASPTKTMSKSPAKKNKSSPMKTNRSPKKKGGLLSFVVKQKSPWKSPKKSAKDLLKEKVAAQRLPKRRVR